MQRSETLSHAWLGDLSLLKGTAMVILGSVLVAASAQVTVPMYPVPMTLQTLAISLIGLTYGSRLAGLTLLAYLAEGAAGLPVFAGGGAGVAHLLGPTGGFLLAFPAMAWLTGLLVESGLGRGVVRLFVAAFVPALLLFVPGVLWLLAFTPLDLYAAMAAGALPFQIGGIVKSALAALLVAAGWRAVGAQGRI